METSAPKNYQANLKIPIDFFVSVKHKVLGVGRSGYLKFVDASGNLLFRVDRQSRNSDLPHRNRLLLDASGTTLISLRRNHNGYWLGFKGDDNGEDLLFRAGRTLDTFTRSEFDVYPVCENIEDSDTIKVRGCPFGRSCTIYRGDSIIAQTSLMYTLGFRKIFVSRRRFRLTIFPGFVDYAFVVALVIMFFDGERFWI